MNWKQRIKMARKLQKRTLSDPTRKRRQQKCLRRLKKESRHAKSRAIMLKIKNLGRKGRNKRFLRRKCRTKHQKKAWKAKCWSPKDQIRSNRRGQSFRKKIKRLDKVTKAKKRKEMRQIELECWRKSRKVGMKNRKTYKYDRIQIQSKLKSRRDVLQTQRGMLQGKCKRVCAGKTYKSRVSVERKNVSKG